MHKPKLHTRSCMFSGMTTRHKFTVVILHPDGDRPMVADAIHKAGGFVHFEHWTWAQTNGQRSQHHNLFAQNRVDNS